jgi:hypothetical protein
VEGLTGKHETAKAACLLADICNQDVPNVSGNATTRPRCSAVHIAEKPQNSLTEIFLLFSLLNASKSQTRILIALNSVIGLYGHCYDNISNTNN